MGKIFLEENVVDSMNPTSKGTILRSMAIFTAIELCGSILRCKTGQGETKDNFFKFCQSRYIDTKYHKICDLLYKIFRNGVHHNYVAKGGALLTSDKKLKNDHLKFFEKGLLIHVPSFADDVTSALNLLVKDIKSQTKIQKNYETVLTKIYSDGLDIYNTYITKNKIITEKKDFYSDIKF